VNEQPPGREVTHSTDLVVRDPVVEVDRAQPRVAALRRRVQELARHPVTVASASALATVGTGLAVNAVRHAVTRGPSANRATSTPLLVTGYVVQHVHVVHHVVHHMARPALPPGWPPAP